MRAGKNALLKRDATGLTASLIDLSQADVCAPGHGATGRALDMYAFGNLLYFACYGVVAHSLPWNRYSCAGSPKGLTQLQTTHEELHPGGHAAPRGLFCHCHERVRAPMDALMEYCWAPALAVAKAAPAGNLGAVALSMNHTWLAVVAQLETMRMLHVPLFRFS